MRTLSNITFPIVLLAAAACGSSPTKPPPPPPQLQLSCPAPVVREATGPDGAVPQFEAPIPTGGRGPYVVECAPGSSSMFGIGETSVSCSATDADRAQASCGFRVTVRVSQTIAKTKFLAFGDSMTEGVTSLEPLILLGPPDTYPYKLERLLWQRYPSQQVVVINRGLSGEDTREGVRRIAAVLDSDKPEVLLLLEGINNINALATATQVSGLRTMIVEAQRRGVEVIIATVMPVSSTWRHYQPGNTLAKIQALNAEIFSLAAQFNLGSPVDLFSIFQATPSLIGSDGLHPTAEGQTRIAEAFRDEIVRRYDVTTSSGFSMKPIDGR